MMDSYLTFSSFLLGVCSVSLDIVKGGWVNLSSPLNRIPVVIPLRDFFYGSKNLATDQAYYFGVNYGQF